MSQTFLDETTGFEGNLVEFEPSFEESTIADEDDMAIGNNINGSSEQGDVDEAFLGTEKGEQAEVTQVGLEAVPGFDESILYTSRQELAESLGQERLLDAWYADMDDPAIGALLQQPGFANMVSEVVIGTDDRIRITGTTNYPWRTICSLLVTAQDNSRWIGTGWLVGHRTVITAGHVIYIHSRGGWVKNVEVIPGRNGASRPYGSCQSSALRSVTGWTKNRKRSHDYGAIILPSNCPYGQQLGYFGYGNYSSSTLRNLTVNISGYPGDKPSGTQWWHARKVSNVNSRTLVYNIDTAGGQSGSPVWRVKDGKRYAVGIHTNGSSSGNSATRITKPVFDNIKKWKAEGQL
jgi:V8-like Glu-specific endopeptidase